MRPTVVLSIYWFLLLGALGAFFPFYSLYLEENAGLSGEQVGVVLAILPLVGIFAQPAWGYLADRSGSRTRILGLVSLGTACGYAVLSFARGFPGLAVATAALAVFSTAAIPTCVAVSLALVVGRGQHAFGIARAWGTVGFFVVVVGLPVLLDRAETTAPAWMLTPNSPEPALVLMLPAAALLCAAAAAVTVLLPTEGDVRRRSNSGDWRLLARNRPFVRVIVVMFATYFCVHGPMVFFPVYVRSLGGSLATVSRMWVFMLLLEIPLVAMSGLGLRRLGGRALLGIGMGAGAIRWLVCGLSDTLWLVYGVQLLHGVMVTGLIVGAPLYVETVVPHRLRSTGQGMLAMMGASLGGITSSLVAGWLTDAIGPAAPALFGGIAGLALTLALPLLIPRADRSDPPEAGVPPIADAEGIL